MMGISQREVLGRQKQTSLLSLGGEQERKGRSRRT